MVQLHINVMAFLALRPTVPRGVNIWCYAFMGDSPCHMQEATNDNYAYPHAGNLYQNLICRPCQLEKQYKPEPLLKPRGHFFKINELRPGHVTVVGCGTEGWLWFGCLTTEVMDIPTFPGGAQFVTGSVCRPTSCSPRKWTALMNASAHAWPVQTFPSHWEVDGDKGNGDCLLHQPQHRDGVHRSNMYILTFDDTQLTGSICSGWGLADGWVGEWTGLLLVWDAMRRHRQGL